MLTLAPFRPAAVFGKLVAFFQLFDFLLEIHGQGL